MRNILSSRMNAATLNTAFELLWAQASRAVYYPTDSMDGTPLNQAIVVSDKLINDFRKKYKLEIVNTIILTDGCSDPCMSIHNPAILPPKKNGTRYILKDDVTKATHVIGRSLYDMTDLLLKVLKSRTNTNLIGFYLHNGGIKSLNWIIDYTILNNDKTKKLWNDEGYLSTTAKGYDEYYIVKCGGKTAGADVLDVNAKMTKAKIAKAFIKYSEKKTTNRVLLSKFMARVSAKVA
jgi:hypothetical protein